MILSDDRRRGGRSNRQPDDNRRHTLNNDMMVYAQQNQNQLQRSMDLEVNCVLFLHFSHFNSRHSRFLRLFCPPHVNIQSNNVITANVNTRKNRINLLFAEMKHLSGSSMI